MKALITGATGFIGRQLVRHFERPKVLTRDPHKAAGSLGDVEAFAWEPSKGPPPAAAFDDVDVVIHLAGDPVAEGRWNRAKKDRILQSREVGTRNLVVGLENCSRRPRTLISASAVGYYGSRGDEVLTEDVPPADDFLAKVCLIWERESARAEALGVRVVNPRIGIVLGDGGGALEKMLPPFKMGVGGRLGDGRQWMPWVHVDDVIGLILHAANHESIRGPMNAVSPNPVTNIEFTRVLGRVLRRPTFLPAPALALRLAIGEFSEVLLASQRVMPRVALESGYHFHYPDLDAALRAAIKGKSQVAVPGHAH